HDDGRRLSWLAGRGRGIFRQRGAGARGRPVPTDLPPGPLPAVWAVSGRWRNAELPVLALVGALCATALLLGRIADGLGCRPHCPHVSGRLWSASFAGLGRQIWTPSRQATIMRDSIERMTIHAKNPDRGLRHGQPAERPEGLRKDGVPGRYQRRTESAGGG